ncbi:hypothetical protein F444_11277 [Phytophthora nicotianae P1976]|uniref:Transposase putative helix-turn-helix domain-containing protein n=1 Tax=Phytophthora nicotianae P1976 TaxID=1317066 RepID=A0A081A1F0_PHYNI|nr:hypothetical protein F444_11277 [Phytophthora nicotianae P1976]
MSSKRRKKSDPPDEEKSKRRRSQKIAEPTRQKTASDDRTVDQSDKKKPKSRRSSRTAKSAEQKTTTNGRVLVHPSTWFDPAVAKDLWMPDADSLQAVEKNSHHPPLVDRLLTSWFDVTNFTDVFRATTWGTMRTPSFEDLREDLRALGELSEESKSVNSVIKIRLYPTTLQRGKLEQMFTANRAVYNKLIARSKEDRAMRLVPRGNSDKNEKNDFGRAGG